MRGAVGKVLIVGGGFSGMAAAIELQKRGVDVHLVEIDKDWRSYGAGISLGGPTLRIFRTLGILDEFLERGYAADGVDVFDPAGNLLAKLPTPRLAGDDVPAAGAIMRPVLAAILARAVRAAGVKVTLGHTFVSVTQDADGATVTLTDGSADRYDLVVGADGQFSKMRETFFPDAPKPKYTGQCVWRAVVDTPAGIEHTTMWVGQNVKVGVNPVSKTQSYVFITADEPTKQRFGENEYLERFKKLLEQFIAPLVVALRSGLSERNAIVYRPLEALILPLPWHRGRIVLIGDAVHATTPHLASGACIGLEDAVVLAEELERERDLDAALTAFGARRWERCRMVVENSVRLGEIEIMNGDKREHAAIMRESMIALAGPI